MAAASRSLGLIVAAAGYGRRAGGLGPKQYTPLLGIPMLQRTLDALDGCAAVSAIVVVVNPEHVEFCRREIVAERFGKVEAVVEGGAERALSVLNGLRALAGAEVLPADAGAGGPGAAAGFRYLGVHDGARPFVACADIERLLARLDADPGLDGALLAVPSVDTMKLVEADGVVAETPARARAWRAQTPQVFRPRALLAAYSQPEDVLQTATDDASLVEARGGRVAVVEGSQENIKITTALDLVLAERILTDRRR
jgi:2-C-methyl-D-erythritol 4-phosphate cytidylyltransferase